MIWWTAGSKYCFLAEVYIINLVWCFVCDSVRQLLSHFLCWPNEATQVTLAKCVSDRMRRVNPSTRPRSLFDLSRHSHLTYLLNASLLLTICPREKSLFFLLFFLTTNAALLDDSYMLWQYLRSRYLSDWDRLWIATDSWTDVKWQAVTVYSRQVLKTSV